jgi:hypothetical protein
VIVVCAENHRECIDASSIIGPTTYREFISGADVNILCHISEERQLGHFHLLAYSICKDLVFGTKTCLAIEPEKRPISQDSSVVQSALVISLEPSSLAWRS